MPPTTQAPHLSCYPWLWLHTAHAPPDTAVAWCHSNLSGWLCVHTSEHSKAVLGQKAAFTPPSPLKRLLSHESATSILTIVWKRVKAGHLFGLLEGVRTALLKSKVLSPVIPTEGLLMLTDVPGVTVNYGKPTSRFLHRL